MESTLRRTWAEVNLDAIAYKRPFDVDKFYEFMENEYPEEIIRAKGYIWFSNDDIHVQLFEQAGRNATVSEVSNWVSSFSEEEMQEVLTAYPDIKEDWDEAYGDRLNQIVFIGRDYDRDKIKQALDDCLAV